MGGFHQTVRDVYEVRTEMTPELKCNPSGHLVLTQYHNSCQMCLGGFHQTGRDVYKVPLN